MRKKIKAILSNILYKLNLKANFFFPKPFQKWGLRGENLIGVEVGVFKGENSLSLLKKSSIKKLYLVDPYAHYECLDSYLPSNFNSIEQEAKKRLINYKDNIIWIKKKSEDALNDIPNGLDFVYLDGNHEYKYIKKDIEDYYPKIKEGGFLAGDDFYKVGGDHYSHSRGYGVVKAVLDFVNKYNLELYVLGNDWWVIKPIKDKKNAK